LAFRFTGTVLAVLVANILTIAVLTGAYVYLRSDHGQELLYELCQRQFKTDPLTGNIANLKLTHPWRLSVG